ncbi:nucleotidyltransferase domain-containing protein [Paenibacillus harenae]|uniref:nucleotidyltransferase domain-containing protein n=1 Tax=Paenibacillus harenae TaxID=306543 RepID=UPI0004263B49|nr:nucleotidyltransferase domain-containing protein [Paenibacillus harenae]
MYEHHKRALNKLVNTLEQEPSILAVITAGSIAQGKTKESSDVDVYLVVSDESYDVRKKSLTLSYINHDREICNYEGGYIDGKSRAG